MSGNIQIRKYRPQDHNQVVQLYKNGIHENSKEFYKSFYNGKNPMLIIIECLIFLIGNYFGHHVFQDSHAFSIFLGSCLVAVYCVFAIWWKTSQNRSYVRRLCDSDLKDIDLIAWTRYPNAFFVATSFENDSRVLGIIGCRKIADTTIEFARLTVAPEARKLGIGRKMLTKVIEHAKDIGCNKVYCNTLRTMYAALNLYKKFGFREIGQAASVQTPLYFPEKPYCIRLKHMFKLIGEDIPDLILEI